MNELCGMTPEMLSAYMVSLGQGAFRGRQVLEWVTRGATIEEMTNLPLSLRARMSAESVANPVTVRDVIVSKLDGTEKYLFELRDAQLIEGVLMRYKHGATLCLSTQAGCKMGCAFCASTIGGCARDLTPGEMMGQILAVNRRLLESGERVHNVVLMGSGEPFDNYQNVVDFLRIAIDMRGLDLSARGISLSTCGLVPRMRAFAQEGIPVTLSLSLHAPNDDIRKRLMPIANVYGIDETVDALKEYIAKTGRRVIIEYALVDQVNCEVEHADELASRLRGMQCHVNLIPLNAVPERALKPPSEKKIAAFLKRLTDLHISATRRREMGRDIEGACGQLRRKAIEARAETEAPAPEPETPPIPTVPMEDVPAKPQNTQAAKRRRGEKTIMKAYALTNIGKVRPVNEDAFYLPREGERFAAVADGMGGHQAGEVASALAIEVFSTRLRAAEKIDMDTLLDTVEAANRAIYDQSLSDRTKRGMGTTLTALTLTDECMYLSHVGDSRAYLMRNRAMIQLSNDHSLVNELVEKGEITPSEARIHPQRNLITRALGTAKRVVPDIIRLDAQVADAWLLCSDGLSNYLNTMELAEIMMRDASPEAKLQEMIDQALARGGADNITAMIVLSEEAVG